MVGWHHQLNGHEFDKLWEMVRASLVAQRLKRLPPMWETWVRSLGWEDPLEKEMVSHSSILAWRIPWTEKPGRLPSTGLQRVRHDWARKTGKLAGCSPWGRKELEMTERLHLTSNFIKLFI